MIPDSIASPRIRYPLYVATLGFISLISIVGFPIEFQWRVMLVGFVFIVGLTNTRIQLLNQEFSLVQIICIGMVSVTGYFPSAVTLVLGVFVGQIIRPRLTKHPSDSVSRKTWWLDTGFLISSNLLPLVFVFFLGDYGNFLFSITTKDVGYWVIEILAAIIFGITHLLIYVLGFGIRRLNKQKKYWRELATLISFEVILIPNLLLATEVYLRIGIPGLAIYWGLLGVIVVFGMMIYRTKTVVNRREQELSILDQVSKTLRSTLELDELLPVIQNQISQILRVGNFYVALYDSEKDEIWYPLAVKHGQRKDWGRRPMMMDRLTDRVIGESKPLLLTPRTQAGSNPIGLPPSEDTPTSWLGVPLIVSDHAIGCLAVSELSAEIEFNSDDIDLLTIVSGQVSVAIDNALLYNQAKMRANRLKTISRLTGSISSSLNPKDVLAQVCDSVAIAVNAQSSGVYLVDHGRDTVCLSYAHHLSEGFIKGDGKYSIAQNKRTRCLRTGQPYIHPEIQSSTLDIGLIRLFRVEGIEAFADFPLITPDGAIGFLSVFYNQPHVFHKEEIDVLQTFASQAALAVSNARLHAVTGEQLSRRLQQLALLEAVGRELSAAILSDELLQLILEYALELTNADQGSVAVFDPETQKYEVKVSYGKKRNGDIQQYENLVSARTGYSRQDFSFGEFTPDDQLITEEDADPGFQIRVPIQRDVFVLGEICLNRFGGDAFDEGDHSLVIQLANQAAIALHNAQLLSTATHDRDRLSAILNSVKEGILLVNTNGKVLLVNESFRDFAGVPIAEISNRILSELPIQVLDVLNYSKDEIQKLQTALTLGQIPTTQKLEYSVERFTPPIVVDRETSPVYGSDGLAIGWMIVLRNKTEEFEIARARDVITQTLVHDLRSPMSAVIGAVDLIETTLLDDESDNLIRQALRVAHGGSNRVLGLVETLLEIAHLESSQIDIALTPIDILSIVDEILPEFTFLANEVGLIIINDIPDNLPTFLADEEKIKRVITNLLDNAMKFTPDGGQVRISSIVREDDTILVKIEDTGPGIPEEYREKVFDQFFQIPGRGSRRRGSGLGLSFCKLAIAAHHGEIWVSAEPGGGSIFCFTLPIRKIEDL